MKNLYCDEEQISQQFINSRGGCILLDGNITGGDVKSPFPVHPVIMENLTETFLPESFFPIGMVTRNVLASYR
jgi:hypothetical protein